MLGYCVDHLTMGQLLAAVLAKGRWQWNQTATLAASLFSAAGAKGVSVDSFIPDAFKFDQSPDGGVRKKMTLKEFHDRFVTPSSRTVGQCR